MAVDTLPATETPDAAAPRTKRLVSLDVFRGATIIGMILVNNPGTWAHIYPPLRHAAWHGWTPTDLIFPFFLFIVGVAIPLAYTKRLARGVSKRDLVAKAAKRTVILFGLGLMMAAYPFFEFDPSFRLRDVSRLRIMGVLQRIALCYLAASLLFLYLRSRARYVALAALLLGYWALMTLVPVPGYGAGVLDTPEATLAAYLDRLILGSDHLWVGADRMWDPEGLLSTLPAIGTTLFGVWTGRLVLGERRSLVEKAARLLVTGVALVIAGYVWDLAFPINKSLWTSSYAVFTAGQAMCVLGLCFWLIDVKGHERWTMPFVVYGVNALTVFVLSGILAKTLLRIQVADPSGGGTTSLQRWIFESAFLPLAAPIDASLLYAVAWILMWFVILWGMYRRNIIVKV